jgi:hypothetical protein
LRNILIISLLVCLVGCGSLYFPLYYESSASQPIDLEVLRPADTSINQTVKNLLVFIKPGLVPRLLFKDEAKQNIDGKLKFEKLPEIEFHSMADLLSGSPRFTIFEPVNPISEPEGKFYNRGKFYGWSEIDSICTHAGTDACLFLSRQDVIIGIKKMGSLLVYKNFKVSSFYEFYIPAERRVLIKEENTIIDFDKDEGMLDELFENGPDSIINDMARENGEKFATWIAPFWQRDTRKYYLTGNKEMESVRALIDSDKMDEVYTIWRKNIYNENNLVAHHAMYNSILSYELEGKLDSALLMTKIAFKRFKYDEMIDYNTFLEERIKENELVKIQLGIK